MTTDRSGAAGLVGKLGPIAAQRPLPAGALRIADGFWSDRIAANAEHSLVAGLEQLTEAGTLENLRLAAGTAQGTYNGRFPFLDTDVYKWLEVVSWRLQSTDSPEWTERADEVIALVAEVQQEDGYLNSYTTVVLGGERWADLPMGHELLYCAGHLI